MLVTVHIKLVWMSFPLSQ